MKTREIKRKDLALKRFSNSQNISQFFFPVEKGCRATAIMLSRFGTMTTITFALVTFFDLLGVGVIRCSHTGP